MNVDPAVARDGPRAARWLVWTAALAAGAVGLVYGFEVGQRVAGFWLGLVMALNAAALGALVAGSVMDRLLRRIGPRQQGR